MKKKSGPVQKRRNKGRVPSKLSRLIRKVRIFAGRNFDRKFGVDTSGVIGIKNLDISTTQKRDVHGYGASPEPAIRGMLERLDLDHSKYTFIDYGSGKGRVLLLASGYPFARIIGIEFSRKLHEIARDNIEKWNHPGQKCRNIESICIDARNFNLPPTPMVLYFFTPFPIHVIQKVVDKIRETLKQNPRPIRILYYGTRQDFIAELTRLDLSYQEIYSHRPFSALGKYKGYLFQPETK